MGKKATTAKILDKKVKGQTYVCDVCDNKFKTASGLEKHAVRKHYQKNMVVIVENGVIDLKPADEMFCQLFVMGGPETRDNQYASYLKAFNLQEELDALSDEPEYKEVTNEKTGEVTLEPIRDSSPRAYRAKLIRNSASILYAKPYIQARCIQLLNALLKDEIVDAELAKIIMQKDVTEATKLNAIKEYNALRQRIIKKEEHTHKMVGVVKHVYERARKLRELKETNKGNYE